MSLQADNLKLLDALYYLADIVTRASEVKHRAVGLEDRACKQEIVEHYPNVPEPKDRLILQKLGRKSNRGLDVRFLEEVLKRNDP